MIAVATDKITIGHFLEMELEDGFRYELINGEIAKHPSSASFQHQKTSLKLSRFMDTFITDNDLGECVTAPFDVYFTEIDLYQPDIMFISNARAHIIRSNHLEDAPDLIVEILSPGTHRNDRGRKMKIYGKNKVMEYWIVDPVNHFIEIYALENDGYDLIAYAEKTGEVESKLLAGLKIDLEKVFFKEV